MSEKYIPISVEFGSVSVHEQIGHSRNGEENPYIGPLKMADVLEQTTEPDPLEALIEDERPSPEMIVADLFERAKLTARQREVIGLRFGLGGRPALSQLETAERLGISHRTVFEIEQLALKKLQSEHCGLPGFCV